MSDWAIRYNLETKVEWYSVRVERCWEQRFYSRRWGYDDDIVG